MDSELDNIPTCGIQDALPFDERLLNQALTHAATLGRPHTHVVPSRHSCGLSAGSRSCDKGLSLDCNRLLVHAATFGKKKSARSNAARNAWFLKPALQTHCGQARMGLGT